MRIIGIGVDLCKVTRIQKIMEKPYWDRFVDRVLCESEKRKKDSPQFVASRWAVKEAVVKATGKRDLMFRMIEVYGNGKPEVRVLGGGLDGVEFFVSISHEEDIAAAFVVAVSGER